MTTVRYTAPAGTVTLSVPRDPFAIIDHVRAKFHPAEQPSMREPAFLDARKIAKKNNIGGKP